uniref:Uncharacterized protein n=1 Tax=Arundo donax TaxID=35708 RepID=A0A0A9ES82_ARUDO
MKVHSQVMLGSDGHKRKCEHIKYSTRKKELVILSKMKRGKSLVMDTVQKIDK